MMLVALMVGGASAFSAVVMPDCSTTACPTLCTCVEDKCADSVNACLADSTCATGQACVDKCACGDTTCLITCGLENPSPKASAVLSCMTKSCPNPPSAPAITLSAASTCSAFSEEDCGKNSPPLGTACCGWGMYGGCQDCPTEPIEEAIEVTLSAASTCSAFSEEDCGKNSPPLGTACCGWGMYGGCQDCPTEPIEVATEVKAAAMPDCSTTACPTLCTCVEDKCADSVNACLADSTCATGQACVDKCACGDTTCLITCGLENPSPKASAVLSCMTKSCPNP